MNKNFLLAILGITLFSCQNSSGRIHKDAEFPGGIPELTEFIQNNIVYPESAVENEIEGTCYIQFVVTKTGKVRDLRLKKGIKACPECNREALNVIRKMPDWEPAKAFGKNINSFYSIPITFALE